MFATDSTPSISSRSYSFPATSTDSVGFLAGDANLYRYVGNKPTTFTDPDGLMEKPITIWFPDEGWFDENDPKYQHPWYNDNFDDHYFGVLDEEEIYEILGLDPDTVTSQIRHANIYGNRTPYIHLEGEDNNGNCVQYFGQFEDNPGSGVGHQGYTFYGSFRDLSYNMTGSDKLKALQALAPYYGLGGGATFLKPGIGIPGVRPIRPIRIPNRGVNPNAAGRSGELLSDAASARSKITIHGRNRIPDRLTTDLLREVKNVKSQSFTRQLRDFCDYAQDNGLTFELWVRRSTKLSGPLKQAIADKKIILKFIPLAE